MTDTVLLVDDHPVLRQGLRVLLEKERFRVVGEAADGLEAIDVAEQLLGRPLGGRSIAWLRRQRDKAATAIG